MPQKKQGAGQQGNTFSFGNYPAPGGDIGYGDPLGLNLGLGGRGRAAFRQATLTPGQPGRLDQFFAQHKRAGSRFQNALQDPNSYQGRLAGAYKAGGPVNPQNYINPTPVPPPPSYPTINPGAIAGGTQGPPGTGIDPSFFDQRNQLLSAYQAPLSDVYQAYMNSFNKGGPIDIPSFQEMYGSYRDVAEREAQRRGADITEALGARGARYGSDILNAQNSLQRDLANDLRYQSGQFLTGLRQQQYNELQPIGQAQQGINNQALQQLMQAYQQQTLPPQLFTGQPPQFQQPTTVLY